MQTSSEIPQKKKQSWYIRDPAVREIVRDCVFMRLSENESLEELKKKGYDIPDRTFRRIKRALEPDKQRLDKIVKQNFLVHAIKAFDNQDMMEKRLLNLLKNAKTVSEELSIIREFRKISKETLELHDSNPVIALLLRNMENEKKNGIEEKPTESP